MKNKKVIISIGLIVIVTGLTISSKFLKAEDGTTRQSGDNTRQEATSQEQVKPNTVLIQNYAFSPARLSVKKGTTITWVNNDVAKHNVVTETDSPMADGPNGPLIGKGEEYSYTFDTPGKYQYYCEPHPYMKGTVEVIE